MQIYWNKRNRLHKKRVQLPEVWFGTGADSAVTSCENTQWSSIRRESKTVLDSGFHAEDSGFQSLVGFRIPWPVFQIPKPRIPDHPQVKISRIPNLTRKNILDSLAWGELKYTQLPMNRKYFIVNCKRNKFPFYYYAYTPKRILAGFYLAVCFCAVWGRQSSQRFLYQTLRISLSLQRYVLSSCDYKGYIFVALIQT